MPGSPPHDDLQRALTSLNHVRFTPALPADGDDWRAPLEVEHALHVRELEWLAAERTTARAALGEIPREPAAFIRWFEELKANGPGQRDPLFPWLAEHATLDQLKWFLHQEVGGEAGFDDLVALAQLRVLEQAKLEMARNYWDEMGRGAAHGMHGPMLARLAQDLGLAQLADEPVVWESRALGNLMAGFAANRCYAYHAIGALGVVELTAPGRSAATNAGLKRAGVPPHVRQYYALHATLDIKHSEAWNAEVLAPLVADNPDVAPAIAEGAWLRLHAGERCFARYRRELGVCEPAALSRAA